MFDHQTVFLAAEGRDRRAGRAALPARDGGGPQEVHQPQHLHSRGQPMVLAETEVSDAIFCAFVSCIYILSVACLYQGIFFFVEIALLNTGY